MLPAACGAVWPFSFANAVIGLASTGASPLRQRKTLRYQPCWVTFEWVSYVCGSQAVQIPSTDCISRWLAGGISVPTTPNHPLSLAFHRVQLPFKHSSIPLFSLSYQTLKPHLSTHLYPGHRTLSLTLLSPLSLTGTLSLLLITI